MTATQTDHPSTEAGPTLAHHFENIDQQHAGAVLGMWTFLATEVMFFGGLFTAYAVFRILAPWEFVMGSRHLSVPLGAINTAVLLVSSLTMAMAVHDAQAGRPHRRIVGFMIATMVLGCVFLGIKGVEYHREYEEHLVPGLNYRVPDEDMERLNEISAKTGYVAHPERMEMFAVLYFFMTGLHAVHLVIGIVMVGIIAWWVGRGQLPGGGPHHVEIAGLYWHFIDVVWVFLYPLLYLIDIHK
jgi:cytochrome c oxidase subunit 3